MQIDALYLQTLSNWRRKFHTYPEPGWLEFWTTSEIAEQLEAWGYDVYVGKELNASERMGVPKEALVQQFFDAAKAKGAREKWLSKMEGGYTGALAILETGKPGPTILFRVDIDALPIFETLDEAHVPNKLGFRSQNDGYMHACGHDSHMAIGLGLAEQIMIHKEQLTGTIKILFQPAEEGVRGAASIVDSPYFANIDYLFALHIGTGVKARQFVAGTEGFFATTKYDVTIKGVAAHAGSAPEEGKNALLAAAQAALSLHSLPTHSGGGHRLNVGTLRAGSGRNVIASQAEMEIEVRGETTNVNEFYEERVQAIFASIAQMYGVTADVRKVGNAISITSDRALCEKVASTARAIGVDTVDYAVFKGGSEDATFLMRRVQQEGGQAVYSIMGTDLAAGHHHECFDIREEDMLTAVNVWLCVLVELQR